MPALMMQPDMTQEMAQSATRQQAMTSWQAQGWPGPRVESWRFTPLAAIADRPIAPVRMLSGAVDSGAPVIEGAAVIRFTNGVVDPDTLAALPAGVTVGDLASDEAAMAELRQIVPAVNPVSDLSLAMMSAGLVLDIAGSVETPIMLVHTGDANECSTHPVILVRVAAGASAVLAEWHGSEAGIAAPLMGISLGKGAELDMAKLQAESGATAHLAATGVVLGEAARLSGFTLSTGAQLARLETHVKMAGEGVDCTLSAVYLGRGDQHHDVTTYMDHAIGHCTSDQVIRGVLDDRARGVYQGKVHVAEDAQKTDGQQMSRALLLSRKAEADAKPELEIYADDVICAHGATVGELDETQLFYLTSRGIPMAQARAMLIEAFLLDAIDAISNPALAQLLRPAAEAWMATQGETGA